MFTRKGFTLLEWLAVIAIIAIFSAILFPVFAQARGKSVQIACKMNLKYVHRAFVTYATDNDALPTVGTAESVWKAVGEVARVKRITFQHCPAAAHWEVNGGYAANNDLLGKNLGTQSKNAPLLMDYDQAFFTSTEVVDRYQLGTLPGRHGERLNVCNIGGEVRNCEKWELRDAMFP